MQTTDRISSDNPVVSIAEKPVSRIRKLVSSRNVNIIKRTIEAKYGFMPSDRYCKDLIAFVEEVTNEPGK